MQVIKRVIQAARDRALSQYSVLVRRMLEEADASLAQMFSETRSGIDQRHVGEALQFLRHGSASFLARLETLYREGVERAMRTMYTDLRQGLDNLSADNLSLIDDEAVNRQLEVGHLVQRLRDACDENLGRLNIMIAQIHDDPDVHERENPFRPYLHARALYESLGDQVADEEVAKVLFEHLANSLANHLSAYYAAICDVFDASGIQARLLARPTKLKRHQRDQLAAQLAALNQAPMSGGGGGGGVGAGVNASFGSGATGSAPAVSLPDDFNRRVLPALERMLGMMQASSQLGEGGGGMPGTAAGAGMSQAGAPEALQQLVWNVFNQQVAHQYAGGVPGGSASSPGSFGAASSQASAPLLAPASHEILSRIAEFQQAVASGQPVAGDIAPDQNQLFAVGDKLDHAASRQERMAIDLVAMLFEFILEDEQIPAGWRLQFGRLQIPFLKAAMLAPQMLQDSEHPARKLVNRISSAMVGMDPETTIGKALTEEISRLVKRILQEFDQDVGIFADCLQELERFLEQQLHQADAETSLSVQAAEEAERLSVLQLNTTAALRDLLAPLTLDTRIADFILQIWAKVLARAAVQDAQGATPSQMISVQYRDVLPELVWSVQEKRTPEERNALIKLLPSLVKRLKIGMVMIHLPEVESKTALDGLVEVHTQILRGNPAAAGVAADMLTLEALRQQFARLVVDQENAAWALAEPPEVIEEVVESMLADRGATAQVDVQQSQYSSVSDAEWLAQLQLGACVQMWAADTSVPARLIWVSKHQSLYIFKMEQNAKPLIYSAASLVKALRDGAIRLSEYAPVFDRAVDSLMLGVDALQASRQQRAH